MKRLESIYATFVLAVLFMFLMVMPVSSELVGLWQFEDKNGDVAKDTSGKGHDAILKGCKFDKGKIDGGLKFVSGNAMEVPDDDDFDFGDKLSIALWANIETLPQDHIGLPGKGHDQPIGSFVFHPTKVNANEYELRFYVSIGAAWPMAKSKDLAKFNEWHHLAGTYDGSKIKVYIDGKLSGETDQKGKMNTTKDVPLKFTNDCCGRQLVGVLDEIHIFNHAISEEEIKKTMEGKMLSVTAFDNLVTTWGKIKI